MTLDTTGERANVKGWTKEALAAERSARKAAKRAADEQARQVFVRGLGKACADVWDFLLRNVLLSIAIGVGIGTATWEWWNSARGWQDLYPGVGLVAYIGAAAAVGSWYVGFRMARLEGRKPFPENPRKPEANERSTVELVGWVSATLFAYIVCVTGVFIATATSSVEAQNAAKQSRVEFAELVARQSTLEASLDVYSVEYWEAMIRADERSIASQLSMAQGTYEMVDLEPSAGCAAPKLSFNQRRACVRMNGGIDEFNGETVLGLKTELERSQRGLKKAQEAALELAEVQNRVRHFDVLTGDETAQALGQMTNLGNGETALAFLLLILSSLFLAGSGWSTDWALEELDRKRAIARAAALAKRTT